MAENKNEEVYTTTFEDVQQTAEEFGRFLLRVREPFPMVIIMDRDMMGFGFIKQFPDTPYGLTLARRWAIRMEIRDETSSQSFDELKADYCAFLQAEREGGIPEDRRAHLERWKLLPYFEKHGYDLSDEQVGSLIARFYPEIESYTFVQIFIDAVGITEKFDSDDSCVEMPAACLEAMLAYQYAGGHLLKKKKG